MTSRTMVSYGIHMVHACTAEIKEYDVKAHVYSMVALVIGHEVEAWT